MEPRELTEYQTDHDLLILLNERVRALSEAVGGKHADHEARIRILEQQRWMFAGGATVISIVASYVVSVFF